MSKHTQFEHLLSPLDLGFVKARSRVLMGSMHTGLEERKGGWERQAAYFRQRALFWSSPTGHLSKLNFILYWRHIFVRRMQSF